MIASVFFSSIYLNPSHREERKERKKERKKEMSVQNNELIRDFEVKEMILFRIQSWLVIRPELLTAVDTEPPGVE